MASKGDINAVESKDTCLGQIQACLDQSTPNIFDKSTTSQRKINKNKASSWRPPARLDRAGPKSARLASSSSRAGARSGPTN